VPALGLDDARSPCAADLATLGPFFGAGRRRTHDRSIAARQRREEAAALAEMLVEGGLEQDEVYLTPAVVADTMLALDGSELRDELGRPRRAWAGFPDHAHTLKTRAGREYALFAEARGIGAVTQVVIRPPNSIISLTSLATWHAHHSAILSEMLRYARRSRAPGFAWDLVSAEIRNAGRGGWVVDGHFHLTTRDADPAALGRVQEYFEARGWSFWFTPTDDDAAGEHPVALIQYQAKGLADALEDGEEWRPDALAELRRQTRCLALTRATGAFRRWKSEVRRAGLVAVEDKQGKPTLVPRRVLGKRFRRKLDESTSAIVLRLCIHDFGDGLFRRAIRVRGGAGTTLADVATAYDLDSLTYLKGTRLPRNRSRRCRQPPLPKRPHHQAAPLQGGREKTSHGDRCRPCPSYRRSSTVTLPLHRAGGRRLPGRCPEPWRWPRRPYPCLAGGALRQR